MTIVKRFVPLTASEGQNEHVRSEGATVDCSSRKDQVVLESCHSIWIFDATRGRFRRILKGVNANHRPVATQWRPYWRVELDAEGDGFTVFLNASRTRLLRSWRHMPDCATCAKSGDTAELSLESIRLTLHGIDN
jgi:hypothetical protein